MSDHETPWDCNEWRTCDISTIFQQFSRYFHWLCGCSTNRPKISKNSRNFTERYIQTAIECPCSMPSNFSNALWYPIHVYSLIVINQPYTNRQTTPDPTRSRSSRPQVESWLPSTSRSRPPRLSAETVALLWLVSLLWDQDSTLRCPRPTRPSREPTVVPDVPTVSRRELWELSWLRSRRSSRECWRISRRRRRRLPSKLLPPRHDNSNTQLQ